VDLSVVDLEGFPDCQLRSLAAVTRRSVAAPCHPQPDDAHALINGRDPHLDLAA
jgi:hypothetical protein